ncbi:MAG: abortive infection family protein [Actinomycetota bacterium]|nr:abortive infection family protein [Actinomycetota bacterium]
MTSGAAPLSDAVIIAISRLVDDRDQRRDPSHSDLQFQIDRVGLKAGDPGRQPTPVGKEKRVRGVLSYALEYDEQAGRKLVSHIVAVIRASGGFRPDSPNYVGEDAIANARSVFSSEGFLLSSDGDLRRKTLETFGGAEVTEALRQYVRRALAGSEDDALQIGTGKDLLEATAAHVLVERFGSYPSTANFPTLLGQAFVAVGLATPETPPEAGEPAKREVERALYRLGCAINRLRNKEGTGHGRPLLPTVSAAEAQAAIRGMGLISQVLLDQL